MIGLLFGNFYSTTSANHAEARSQDYIFGNRHKDSWTNSIRTFVLAEANARFPDTDHLVIKEPNSSIGAPLLLDALPESSVLLLVRDPRDAVSSSLAAHKKGGWLYEYSNEAQHKRWSGMLDEEPDIFVGARARYYASNISNAKRAYEAHKGRKTLVRYEDLRADTLVHVQTRW